jgi:hypothetical protein
MSASATKKLSAFNANSERRIVQLAQPLLLVLDQIGARKTKNAPAAIKAKPTT